MIILIIKLRSLNFEIQGFRWQFLFFSLRTNPILKSVLIKDMLGDIAPKEFQSILNTQF